jgi:hypothetical protein
MKRTGCLLLALALAGPGCLHLPSTHEEAVRKPPVEREVEPPPPPAVLPDQVTESNAADITRALQAEIERAAAERPTVTAPTPGSVKPLP